MQENPRKRPAVDSDFDAILATGNPQLKGHARKEVVLAIDPDVKSKVSGDRAAGRGDASPFQASGSGRGRGRASDFGHQWGQGQFHQRSPPSPLRAEVARRPISS